MPIRALVGTAAAGVMLLLGVVVMGSGGNLAAAKPPRGGCVVRPGTGAGPSGTPGDGPGAAMPQKHVKLNAQQMSIARTIVGVGKGMGIKQRGTALALGTAMQESTLDPHATSPGGRSVGLFQQQGSLYAHVNRTDPVDTSRAFYEMLLKRVPNYADPAAVGFAEAAQTVQASGAGARWYARWEDWATALAGQLYTGTPAKTGAASAVSCQPGGGSGPIPVKMAGTRVWLPPRSGYTGVITAPNRQAAAAIAAGLSYLGTPYAWGGGGPNGPTKGVRDGGVADAHGDYKKIGFDCSGLTQYAYAQAGITVTRPASTQLTGAHTVVPYAQAKPGDLLFWGASPHHVAIYLGEIHGQALMLEAPQSGSHVKISPVRTGGDFLHRVARPAP